MLLKLFLVVTTLSVACAGPKLFRSEEPFLLRSEKFVQNDGLSYRLPNNTKPLHYSLELETNVHKADFDFNGSVRIKVKALEATKSITLHSINLVIHNIQLLSLNSSVIATNADYREQSDVDFLIISLPKVLAVDEIIIVHITYSGILRSDKGGFYRSSYLNAEKKSVFLATTQFEAVYARHAFPCFDEPGHRATFDLQIKHDKSYTAISNTRSSGRTDVKGTDYVVTRFETTPPMQTYLLAFIISDFTFIQNHDEDLRHRVFAKKQSTSAGESKLALDFSEKVLRTMEEHFGVKYSLPKMDQVAVPEFEAGAMENWGLVTYRERSLLYDAKSTAEDRDFILTTIAHEFAHQFFGNLVSPKWWSHLWLNEGFATLYGDYLTSLVYPEERLMDTFVIRTLQETFIIDVKLQERPMTHYAESPEEIMRLFDDIAYSKSGCVLRMIQVALSVETFTKGLQYYLTDNAFKSVEPEDLYKALQRSVNEDMASPVNVKAIMSSWELQSGFPLVTVSRDANNVVILKQERFFKSNDDTWWIPINYVVGSNPNFTSTAPDMWMKGEHQIKFKGSSALKPFTTKDWMIFNIQQTSYYRVNYDDNLWKLLINQLNNGFQQINVVNRAQLIDDSFNLAEAEYINYAIPLSILKYIVNETDYIPWYAASRNIKQMKQLLVGTRAYSIFQKYTQEIVTPLYNKLGVKAIANKHKLDGYARAIAIDLACKAGMKKCLIDTANELQFVMKTNTALAPDIKASIYCNGLRTNDAAFMFLYRKMQKSEDEEERQMLVKALGCSQNISSLNMFMDYALKLESPRMVEALYILKSVVQNGHLGLELAMDFMANNSQFIPIFSYPTITEDILDDVSSYVTTEVQLEKLNHLKSKLVVQDTSQVNKLSHKIYDSHARSNLNWISKNLKDIEDVLSVPITSELTSTTDLSDITTSGVELSTKSSFTLLLSLIIMFYVK